MNAADELRDASRRIRHDIDFGQAYGEDDFLSAVADWLDAEADEIPPHATHYKSVEITEAPAFRVARAYLGADR